MLRVVGGGRPVTPYPTIEDYWGYFWGNSSPWCILRLGGGGCSLGV
jgi:hypothetical protein